MHRPKTPLAASKALRQAVTRRLTITADIRSRRGPKVTMKNLPKDGELVLFIQTSFDVKGLQIGVIEGNRIKPLLISDKADNFKLNDKSTDNLRIVSSNKRIDDTVQVDTITRVAIKTREGWAWRILKEE